MEKCLLYLPSSLAEVYLCDNLGLQVEEPGAGALPDRHRCIRQGALRARLPVLNTPLAVPGDARRERLSRRRRLRRHRTGIRNASLATRGDVGLTAHCPCPMLMLCSLTHLAPLLDALSAAKSCSGKLYRLSAPMATCN